jgi:imidazolonepropionase-like amidohydrolase
MRKLIFISYLLISSTIFSQQSDYTLLLPASVFDGDTIHTGWQVLVKGKLIESVGEASKMNVPSNAKRIELKNCMLLPGLIEGHSHLFLHPYNETSWDDQVLKESRAERIARAINHAKATLMAGFTTVRDLGTEGALYDDVGLKQAIEKGIIPGPRMIVATRAIVAKGTYGPVSNSPDVILPQGAAEVAGLEDMSNEVRTQIGKGADVVKLYADYRWGKNKQAMPTFSIEEMALAVSIARSGGRQVVAHASTAEGMRRAILGGVTTIEHGDNGTLEIFKLMKEKGVALCPTLAAGDATEQYKGWKKGVDPDTEKIRNKKKSFTLALQSGVTICFGGDVGVFPHGDNAREMEMMVDYGMKPLQALRSATSVNADVFELNDRGRIKPGLLADLIAVQGDPSIDIHNIRNIRLVMKQGTSYLDR